ICLTTGMRHLSWYLDNDCSCHLMGERYMFQDLKPKRGGCVTFGGLKHNLLSISQLYDNGYDVSFNKGECIVKNQNDQWAWHKKLGHANLRLISKLKKHNLVRGLPSLVYKTDILCDVCQKEKQVKGSFKSKNIVSTSRALELLHIDLFVTTRTASMSGKHYGLVVVDDYSKWTWVMFLNHKDESFKVFSIFYKRVQNETSLLEVGDLLEKSAKKH
ncbi:hypothetical protein CR513_32324, partial [Mucuna pruriens]